MEVMNFLINEKKLVCVNKNTGDFDWILEKYLEKLLITLLDIFYVFAVIDTTL